MRRPWFLDRLAFDSRWPVSLWEIEPSEASRELPVALWFLARSVVVKRFLFPLLHSLFVFVIVICGFFNYSTSQATNHSEGDSDSDRIFLRASTKPEIAFHGTDECRPSHSLSDVFRSEETEGLRADSCAGATQVDNTLHARRVLLLTYCLDTWRQECHKCRTCTATHLLGRI